MQLETPIREIMTTALITVAPDTPVKEIQKIFAANSFHHLPVVEAGSQLVGIVSREDFRIFYEQLSAQSSGPTWSHMQLEHRRAKDLMTASPLCLDPDDTIGLAADIFLANKFHALPVIEDGLLMGILTTHDILAYSVGAGNLSEEEVG
ncbi:CBS domain-containing protein [Flavilitoribacter nigricans]|uniref:CBS domain-containing protein n=1 Tax=Flavilitoribacter nigricans (strain ATCC 23147 / DSM 23189 / NBRC 102662 / NCIMB 1420 / SS-2) TaxID=1122177 RepID=A0A2D0NFS5_FLAN2|nr:CBS domain-containing protein [Flavilitoribacter nigricans]PHN07327.1 CBS domain-containing protein [Flavilitoribacter nigricans DSM 23189 = NBRC 102662]